MRTLTLALLVLASGCATTTTPRKTAAERAAEIARYRERKAAEEAGKKQQEEADAQAQQPVEPPPAPAASTPPEGPTPAPVLAATPGPVGPRRGLWGLRATLLGSGLALGESAGTTSTLGLRYFVGDSVGVNLNAGFAYASVGKASITGLSLGVGLNILGGSRDKPLRPFFALEGAMSQVGGMKDASASMLSLAAGGGAEYWLTPQLSVSASLLLGFATLPNQESFVLGTLQPGLGVTLYTN
jgi:hypothetical protein